MTTYTTTTVRARIPSVDGAIGFVLSADTAELADYVEHGEAEDTPPMGFALPET